MKTITIGRSSSCDIIIPDPSISRIHAKITRNGNAFIYHDLAKNGTIVNSVLINNEKTVIAPGASVFLAGRIPLPWAEVYALLPSSPSLPSEKPTSVTGMPYSPEVEHPSLENPQDKLNVGLGILAFFIPIAGFIMYFLWKSDTPKRAGKAGTFGLIGLFVNLILIYGL